MIRKSGSITGLSLAWFATTAFGVGLPHDQAELLYRSYDDGDLQEQGSTVAASNHIGHRYAIDARIGQETIDNATPDILSLGTPYNDKRTDWRVGLSALAENMLINVRYQAAREDDLDASLAAAELASNVFGDMTTLTLGYGRGRDEISRTDEDFRADADRRYYRLGLAQALSERWTLDAQYTAALDSGYLGNPYRYARILSVWLPEQVPTTRTAHAVTLATQRYLFDHAALRGEYRYYTDTWAVHAHTLEAAYRQHWSGQLRGELRYRYYTQSAASFYSDNFGEELNYYSRDKELSNMRSHALGASTSWRVLGANSQRLIAYADIGFSYDYIVFDYSNYTDVRTGARYAPRANVLQLNLSIGY